MSVLLFLLLLFIHHVPETALESNSRRLQLLEPWSKIPSLKINSPSLISNGLLLRLPPAASFVFPPSFNSPDEDNHQAGCHSSRKKKKRPFLTLQGDEKIAADSLESVRASLASLKRIWRLWLMMKRRCCLHTRLTDVQRWTRQRLNRVVLCWLRPDTASWGPQERLICQSTLIFGIVLFLLNEAESSVSTKLEQALKKKSC